jgi:hypothetical protein
LDVEDLVPIIQYVTVHIAAGERYCARIASGMGRNATRGHFATDLQLS